PGTVKRDYTQALIRKFGIGCEVALVGSERLAGFAEAILRGEEVADDQIAAEIAPCFVDGPARTDTIVLACTHYPLILDRLEKLAPWPVEWVDPAPAIARRASSLLGAPGDLLDVPIDAYFTSGSQPNTALLRGLAQFGAKPVVGEGLLMPV